MYGHMNVKNKESLAIFSKTHGTRMFRLDPVRKLSANLYDIYICCVYSEKLLMMDRGTARNM